jgi:hypothetical protein
MWWLVLLAAASPPPPDRGPARAILEKHCGECHREDSPNAKAKALAVFNLNQLDWPRSMSDAQLRNAAGRLRNLVREKNEPATEFELFGGFIDPRDLARFEAFVRDELAWRKRK